MHTAAASAGARVGRLGSAELRSAVEVLARAFRDNPLNRAVLGGDSETRRRANVHSMRGLLSVAPDHGLVLGAHRADALSAVLVAAPPYGFPFPAPAPLTRLRAVWGMGLRRARRWAIVFEALSRLHPALPHWYLGVLGVDPEQQRHGIGRMLLEHWLQRVDAERELAYLETDRQANVRFYETAGFEVRGETRVLDVPVWLMQRPPRRA